MIYKSTIKPIFDFFISLFALMLLSPIFLLITLLLTIANSGKPFFTQTRPGKNARLFKVIKFKTMNDKRDKAGKLLSYEKSLQPIPQKHHTHLLNLLHCIKFASAKEVYVYPLTQTETK